MIDAERVGLAYPSGRPALEDVSFSLPEGSFTFLTGHSGAGKSSLLRLIALLERPSGGVLRVGGVDYRTLAPRREAILRRRMGLVFQDNRLLDDRNVFDNVALPLVIGRFSHADIRTRVGAALERVGLGGHAADFPATLSGGERQRVGIARAVVARPRLLLADEPTGNLDPAISADILELFLQFNASGVTVLFATHDTGLLDAFDFPRLTLGAGRLVAPEGAGAPGGQRAGIDGVPGDRSASGAGRVRRSRAR